MNKDFAIIEIGSTNTKLHVYSENNLIYSDNITIEFKKHYKQEQKLNETDIVALYKVIERAKEYTSSIHIYGCSIFRSITKDELENFNNELERKYSLKLEVVSQEDEAYYTALGCYKNIGYTKTICVFIGGGGSVELIFAKKGEIVERKFFNFGVVDITSKFESLKEDITNVSFDDVYKYVDECVGEMNQKADVLILAGGDHLYWYNNAQFELFPNTLYSDSKQQYMIPIDKSDEYDRKAYKISLDAVRSRSDNPIWFDGSRAMKALTNVISHKVDAKYVIPTKINMEDGLRERLNGQR